MDVYRTLHRTSQGLFIGFTLMGLAGIVLANSDLLLWGGLSIPGAAILNLWSRSRILQRELADRTA
ncbi:hypothetical protein KGD82_13525 [Nocardiopsis eucommiae]|uniref:Uncharacterized protein n=1 Tax=Nocardiopsis eucommiae TaxID=2831970 RepID=A0A975QM43_9ACTN|nr:hypothetical protein KGD82_13525 [Nocardiopsis eucommiae]